ncbi:MAG: WG repeat-containing protein [Defluviitaleaceae bacterium]|nr:WG repeat-containing protein [Defluviitaleaceae bacterium]
MKNSRYTSYNIENGRAIAEHPASSPILPRLLSLLRKIPRAGWAAIFCVFLALGVVYTIYSLTPTYHEYFESIRDDSDGLAIVRINSSTQAVVDISTGREIISFRDNSRREYFIQFTNHQDALIIVQWSRDWNWPWQPESWSSQGILINMHTGRRMIPFDVWQAFDGMAIVQVDGFMGLIDIETGAELLPFIYDRIWSASNGMVSAQIDRLWGIIEIETGREIMPFQFDSINTRWIDDGIIEASLNWQPGLFQFPSGREIVPTGRYHQFSCVSGDIARINAGDLNNTLYGIINIETGEELIPFGRYDRIREIYHGMAIVEYHDDSVSWRQPTHVGLVNLADGTEIIPMGMFDNLGTLFHDRGFRDGMIIAWQNEEVGVIDIHTHQEIIPFGQYHRIQLFSDGMAAILQNNKWYFIDI